jgi:Tfp pilus assembly ATPase PilU
VFPPHQQKQVRIQLASVLKAVISQRLIPRMDARAARRRRSPDQHAFIRDASSTRRRRI